MKKWNLNEKQIMELILNGKLKIVEHYEEEGYELITRWVLLEDFSIFYTVEKSQKIIKGLFKLEDFRPTEEEKNGK